MRTTFAALLSLAMLGLGFQTGHAQVVTPPVPAPATATAPAPWKADYSDPKKTMKTMMEATKAGDVTAMKACVVLPGDLEQAKNLEANYRRQAAPIRLRNALVAKFGEDGAKFLPDYAAAITEDERVLETTAVLKMDGEKASVTVPPPPNAAGQGGQGAPAPAVIGFVKVGNDWKIAGGPMLPVGGTPPEFQKSYAVMDGAWETVIAKVEKGEYGSAAGAKKDLDDKLFAAKRLLPPGAAGEGAPN